MKALIRISMLCVFPLIPHNLQWAEITWEPPVLATLGIHEAMPPQFISEFRSYFQSEMDREGSPGAAVAIIKDDQLVFLEGFGLRSTKGQEKVDTETLFRIGSLSKGFAGVLSALLVADTVFSWQDRICRYLPDFETINQVQSDRIAIGHLLSHTTGLARHAYTNLLEEGLSPIEILPEFQLVDLHGPEGQYFAYQNVAFAFIEEIIRQSTGSHYGEVLSERIFQPLHMQRASTSFTEIQNAENVALPHQFWRRKGRFVQVKLNQKYYNAVSAGGINASISEMAQWMHLLLGNRPDIVSEEVLDDVFAPAVQTPRRSLFQRKYGLQKAFYAKGWRVIDFHDRRLIYHGGSVNDYRSEIAIDRENRIAVCALFNAQNNLANHIVPDFFAQYGKFVKGNSSMTSLAKT